MSYKTGKKGIKEYSRSLAEIKELAKWRLEYFKGCLENAKETKDIEYYKIRIDECECVIGWVFWHEMIIDPD